MENCMRTRHALLGTALATATLSAAAQVPAVPPPSAPAFDAELASRLGADEHGMRAYVLVILKTGPTRVPDGPQRDEMFKGHFANINRLAAEGKLAVAGPLDGVQGRRGIFVLAVKDLDEAHALVATDPVVIAGEMVAEFHKFYGSAGLMLVNDTHARVAKKGF
jgi:uncharacterized protein YciI